MAKDLTKIRNDIYGLLERQMNDIIDKKRKFELELLKIEKVTVSWKINYVPKVADPLLAKIWSL